MSTRAAAIFVTHENPIDAWHFNTGELGFKLQGIKVEAGLVLETQDMPTIEKTGYHASILPLDALRWFAVRPNNKKRVSRVKLSGHMIEDRTGTILSAQRREHIWVADAQRTLYDFSIWCLEQVLEVQENAGLKPDKRLRDALAVKTGWVRGETSDNALQIAAQQALEIADAAAAAFPEQHPDPLMLPYNNPPEIARRHKLQSVSEVARAIGRQILLDSQFAALESSCVLVSIIDLVQEVTAWEQVLQREDFVLDSYLRNYPGVSLHIRPPDSASSRQASLSDCNDRLERMLLELEPQGL